MIGSRFSMCARAFAAALTTFILGASAYAQCPIFSQTAQPKSPINVTVPAGSKVNYVWTLSTANSVTGYEVFVRRTATNTFISQCTVTNANSDNCDGNALTAANYDWEVKTYTNTCAAGSDSAFQQFTVGTTCNAPSPPALVSPQDKTTISVNPPTLNWLAVSGADLPSTAVSQNALQLDSENPSRTRTAAQRKS